MPWVNDTPRARMLSRVGAAQAALYKQENDEEPEDNGGLLDRVLAIVRSPAFRGAMILAILFFINAVMAYLKDKVLAHTFGAGPELDAFSNAAWPSQAVFEFLVWGGVVGPFLPIFVSLKAEAESAARDFARTILVGSIVAMAFAMVVVIAIAPQLASLFVPGYSGEQLAMYVGLVRIMALSQIIFAASLVLGEILVAERRFFTYGLADIFYWGGIAGGSLVLSAPFGIYGAALGMVAGASAHLAWRLFAIYRLTGFRPSMAFTPRTKGIGQYLGLMFPKMFSQPLPTLMLLYFGILTSTLAPGSASSFAYARNFQSVAETVIGVAFATAAFPALSAAAAAGDKRAFKRIFTRNLISIGALSLAAGLGLLVLSNFVISFFLRGGAFDETDVSRTSMVLAILALSIPLESLIELLARAIFATQDTKRPTAAGFAFFASGIAITAMLSGPLGLAAIPIGYTAGRAVQLSILAVLLQPRMAQIGGTSRWSRAIVRDRWGDARGGREPMPAGKAAALALCLVVLVGGTAFAGSQVIARTGSPEITPWARVAGTRAPVVAVVSQAPGSSGSADPSSQASVPAGNFTMDLYRPGDFVDEFKDTWCVPAAMQTSINMMNNEADNTRDQQARLFDLAVSIAGSSYGGADPEGWAQGLTSLGYGKYRVDSKPKMADAVKTVVKAIRLTQRPAGLLVWRGWHSWVVSGFTATADPALTDNFKVISLRIEDVWYPRKSNLWSQSRGGMSRPPDSEVLISQLDEDYLPWNQGKVVAGRQGYYVFVEPQL